MLLQFLSFLITLICMHLSSLARAGFLNVCISYEANNLFIKILLFSQDQSIRQDFVLSKVLLQISVSVY